MKASAKYYFAVITAFAISLCGTSTPQVLAQGSDKELREACREDFAKIYTATQEYRHAHKALPDKLSELVKEGLLEKEDIISPITEKTGRKQPFAHLLDPEIPKAYLYEFSPLEMGGIFNGGKRKMRDWKRLQMGLLGGVVPIVRDHLFKPVMNLAFDGEVYASGMNWEDNFKDVVNLNDLFPQALFAGFEKAERATRPAVRPRPSPPVRGIPVGQVAPGISFVSLKNNQTKNLGDFRGKVVVIDFWASWCGPCQGPMAKMQTYRDDHPDWGEKVELIALSIDKAKEAAVKHLRSKGWNKTYNAWAGEGGFRAKAPVAYQVRGIPTCYVIDPEGKVAARGHPAAMDIPGIINGLLAH